MYPRIKHIQRRKIVKVFISWSGNRSKKVAQILRDWLPSVIQSVEPFVSSEDIDKGSRWNTDIAQELKESTFGIICVTKDNLTAPWLNFEAGALSKTIENSYVAPFLFDVKPSELKGLPISQFQATSFTKEDLERLMETLNIAANKCLPDARLHSAFDVWYASLESDLSKLRSEPVDETTESTTSVHPDLLEELLEMTRNTQRLLGNTDVKLTNSLEQLQNKVEEGTLQKNRAVDLELRRFSRKMSPMIWEELMFMNRKNEELSDIFPYNLLVTLSIFRDDFPWLYDAGTEYVKAIQSEAPKKAIITASAQLMKIIEFTCEHPMFRETNRTSKDAMILHEMPMMIKRMTDMYLRSGNESVIGRNP